MMTERGSIEIREEEEGVIAANRTVKGKGNLEEKVLFNIEAKLISEAPSLTHTCIFRIPDRIKKVNETEFVSRLVSIGPLHHCKKSLQAMETIKYWYLHNLLQKASCRTNLKHMVEIVTSMEEYCRDCYDENLDLSSEAFVEMMVVDGCFIIEFYRGMAGEFFTMENMLLHAIEGPDFPRSVAASDLLLLENQLPWGVVECLFELTKEPNQERSCNSLTELCGRGWRDPVETVVCGRPLGIVEEKSRSRHLLDTWRLFLSGPDHRCEVYSWFSLPSSATELVQIGVKFKRRRSDDNILTVTFVNGVMEISPIFGKPFCLLRNLVTMEECDSTGPH
ncbi:putative UPF0481 protein [Rosa sericea]